MKLSISSYAVTGFAASCTPLSTLDTDALKVLRAFRDGGHQYTRRDLNAVLIQAGHSKALLGAGNKAFTRLVLAHSTKVGNGFYSYQDPEIKTPTALPGFGPGETPTAASFYLPLVHVLATLSDYTPESPVSMESAVAQVIALTGVDDKGDFEASGRKKNIRRIQWAFRNHKKGYLGACATPTMSPAGRGMWALTQAGIDLAHRIQGDFVSESKAPLTTAEWFETQTREKAMARRCAFLLLRRHPQANLEEMLSLVGFWFATWGANGYCDEKIAEGHPPTVTVLTRWLLHKYNHGEYRKAKDALHREAGKRTQAEIRKRLDQGLDDFITPSAFSKDPDAPRAVWGTGGKDEEEFGLEWVDNNPAPDHRIEDDARRGLARDLIALTRPRNSDRYIRIFDHLMDGRTRQDLADLEGCTLLRASHLYQRVRDVLRKAPVLVEVALKVLALVTEEPWSTEEEISAEIPEIELPLKLLRRRGLISEGRGSSFAPTPAGRNAVEMGSLL